MTYNLANQLPQIDLALGQPYAGPALSSGEVSRGALSTTWQWRAEAVFFQEDPTRTPSNLSSTTRFREEL